MSSSPEQKIQCMEIVGGNRTVRTTLAAPGLDIWLDSRPHGGHAGGDVYYFSMCGSGRVTRLVVADVSGHGQDTDEAAQWLRSLMRKHINLLDQTGFARAINTEFTRRATDGRFATAVLLTYFAPTDHLIVCNAGHPRPLWYSRRLQRWQSLHPDLPDTGPSIREAKGRYLLRRVADLPLGIIEPTEYNQFAVKLDEGDFVLVYTDAATEAMNAAGEQLREEGLLNLAARVEPQAVEQAGTALLRGLDEWRGHGEPEDDQTLILLRHNGSAPPRITVGGALRTLSRMVGLVRV